MAELMDELNASIVRLHPLFLNDFVDQTVLAVCEPAHRFGVREVVRASVGELNPARSQKVASAVEAGLPVHIKPVVRVDLEGVKGFASLRRTHLKVLVKHLFPARRVNAGSVGDHTVEVEQN